MNIYLVKNENIALVPRNKGGWTIIYQYGNDWISNPASGGLAYKGLLPSVAKYAQKFGKFQFKTLKEAKKEYILEKQEVL